ncbi:MAG: phosphatase [Holophagaceae bacterium]|nr:phosphatase [Holophagaceae bacterium]
MIRFKLQLGDITTMETDAIVNSTDTTMLDGHTVAPTWLDGAQGEREALSSCYENALRLAEVRRVSTLAFPSLGAGRQPQIPLEEAAPVAVGAILNFLESHDYPNQVVMVCYDTDTFLAYQRALKAALP